MSSPYVKRDDMGFVYLGLTALGIGMCVWFWYVSHADIVYYGLKFAWHQLSLLDYPFMPDVIRDWKAELAKLAAKPGAVSFDDFLAAMNKVGYLFIWIPILLTIRGIRIASKHKANLTRRKMTIQTLPWVMSQHSPAIIPTLYYGDKNSLLLNVDPEEHRSAINPEEWVQQNGLLVNGALNRDKCRKLFIEHLGTPFASLGEQAAEEKAEAAEPEQTQPEAEPAQGQSPAQPEAMREAKPEQAQTAEAEAGQTQPEAAQKQAQKAEAEQTTQSQPEAKEAQAATAPIQLELQLDNLPEGEPEQAQPETEPAPTQGQPPAQPEAAQQEAQAKAEKSGEAKPEQAQDKPDPKILLKMQPQEKAMFAIFGTRLFARDTDTEKVTAQDLLDALNRSCHQNTWNGRKGYPDLSITDKAFAQYVTHPDVPGWLQKHAYPRTLLHAMHKEALHTGKLPSSHFRWLKGMDRGLWYALNTTGRKTPFLESAAVYTQTLWEEFAHENGHRLTKPFVDDAIDGLEAYMVKIGLIRRASAATTK